MFQSKAQARPASVIISDDCCEEIRAGEQHDIIAKISAQLGDSPCTLCVAEKIFDSIKYDVARYILHHEFGVHDVDERLLWLEEQVNPDESKRLSLFIDRYLK